MQSAANDILDFWRQAGPERWFRADPSFDALCHERLLDHHLAAARGELAHWSEDADSALALVLLLDQLPRNLFRGSAHAYATDPMARQVTSRALEKGYDQQFDAELRSFFYVPFMHSEDLSDHQRAAALYRSLGTPDAMRWPGHHRAIIERFGRFPHRNKLLGRTTTPDEQVWMDEGGFQG